MDQTPRYDSFLVRLWHESVSGKLLRAEIDHVQTGAVYVAREMVIDWIPATLREAIQQRGHHLPAPGPGNFSNEESDDA